ncbi:YbfB/YjiJ family MFS transporter [Aquamicrobium sp. LC103]|uniref:YbfB/YjiJ family MFS transporter n=1 Tax=Aquamicrobium sp. LC103 TaxID=1120658 RepID=UPI000A853CE7|nr:YbfB/YjiJ family MFS transporter [Aquamicrobium sp. LC103]TKT81089.1 YbfB/YjiJ family MFS transporter [Aquamicrobium sp. LC103]
MDSSSRSSVRYAVAGMLAMAVAMGIGRFVYTPILPGMMDGLGLSASDAGLIASANYAGYLLGAILAAGAWARGHERLLAMGSLAASALLAALMGLTGELASFVAIRFLAGLASAFVMVFLTTIIFMRLAQAGRSDLQAWHFGGVGLGIAASAVMTGALHLADAAWTASWLWAGALSAAGFLVVLLLVDGDKVAVGRPQAEPPLPRNAALTKIIIAYGIFGFGYIVTATFLVAIVRQGDAGPLFESVVWLATGLAGLPSVWIWNRLARRFGLTAVFAAGCVVEAVGVVASVSLGGYAGPLIAAVLLGGTFIAVTAIGLQLGRELAGAAQRRALALMTAAFGVGQILGPIVAGIVADRTGSFVAPSLLAAFALVVTAAFGVAARKA